MRTAAYARYSSDSQREASIDDQLRNIRQRCDREGWPAPTVYSDAAISGARTDRAAYQRLLSESHLYNVLLVDDLSRFGRDKDEIGKTVKRLTFAGVRLVGVSDGVDTARKSHKADVGLRGLMSELYLDDLAEKTHRGLTGRALAGASAGGLPYGYRVTAVGQRAIDEAQATVVRRIYADFLAGRSARTIAAALNTERVPSARGSTWGCSAIFGDVRRGIGVLANPMYAGRQIWNRSRWIKHPDTGRRVRQERPKSEWIITESIDLAIVDISTWDAVQARIRSNGRTTVDGERGGGAGRPAQTLLSGILRCADCGGPMVSVDGYRYGCATHNYRGAAVCANELRVPRKAVEGALLAVVMSQLLSDAAFQRFQRAATDALKQSAPDLSALQAKIVAAERANKNIMEALRAGIVTPGTRAELIATEAELEGAIAALAAAKAYQPSQIMPRAREIWRGIVDRLETHTRDIPAARGALRELIGTGITVKKDEAGAVYAEIGASSRLLVAGAGSVLYLTEPLKIPIPVKPGRRRDWG